MGYIAPNKEGLLMSSSRVLAAVRGPHRLPELLACTCAVSAAATDMPYAGACRLGSESPLPRSLRTLPAR